MSRKKRTRRGLGGQTVKHPLAERVGLRPAVALSPNHNWPVQHLEIRTGFQLHGPSRGHAHWELVPRSGNLIPPSTLSPLWQPLNAPVLGFWS